MKTVRSMSWLVPIFLVGSYLMVPACMTDHPMSSPEDVPSTELIEDEAAASSETVQNLPNTCSSRCTTTEQCIGWCNSPYVECFRAPNKSYGICAF